MLRRQRHWRSDWCEKAESTDTVIIIFLFSMDFLSSPACLDEFEYPDTLIEPRLLTRLRRHALTRRCGDHCLGRYVMGSRESKALPVVLSKETHEAIQSALPPQQASQEGLSGRPVGRSYRPCRR